MHYRILLPILVLAAIFLANPSPLSSPAQANPLADWSPTETNLSGWQAELYNPRLMVGLDGTLAAFWIAKNFSTSQWSLWGRIRQPGGVWTPALNISSYQAFPPGSWDVYWDASVSPDGTVWAVWATHGANHYVRAAYYPPGGPWQSDDPTTQPGTMILNVKMAASLDGHLVATWVDCAGYNTPPCILGVARRFPGASVWEPVETIDDGWSNTKISSDNFYTLVGMGGEAVVIWVQSNPSVPTEWGLFARLFDPGSETWSPPKTSPPISGWKPTLYTSQPVMGLDNTVVAAWNTHTVDPNKMANFSSTRTTGSSAWSTPAQISTARSSSSLTDPILAISENGTTAAIWLYSSGSGYELFANARDPGGAWGTETSLSGMQNGGIYNWHVGIWPNGEALAVWSIQDTKQPGTSDQRLFWSIRPANSIWGGGGHGSLGPWVDTISGMDLALGHNGSAVLVWADQDNSGFYSAEAATWPPGGPWEQPASISGDYSYAVVTSDGLAMGIEGQPVGAAWRADSNITSDLAILFNEQNFPSPPPKPTPTPTTGPPPPGGKQVYLPLVIRLP